MASHNAADLRPLLEYYVSAGAISVAREILERMRAARGPSPDASGEIELRILSAEINLLAADPGRGDPLQSLTSDTVDQIEALVDAVQCCPDPEKIPGSYRDRILLLDVLLYEHRADFRQVLDKVALAARDIHPARAVSIYLAAARAAEHLHKHGEIERWLHKALACAKASHSTERQGEALAALGSYLARGRRMPEALPLMLAALELQTRAGQWRGANCTRLAIAGLYRRQGRLGEALRFCDEAEVVGQAQAPLAARLEGSLIRVQLRQFDQARATLLGSWRLACTAVSREPLLRLYGLLALTHARSRRPAQTRVALSRGDRLLAAAAFSPEVRAEYANHAATALISMGQANPAAERIRAALTLTDQHQLPHLRAEALRLRGEVHLAGRKWQAAAVDFARARDLCATLRDAQGEALALIALGRTRLYLARSDGERAAALLLTDQGAEWLRRNGVPMNEPLAQRSMLGPPMPSYPAPGDLKQWAAHGIITRSRRFHSELLHAAQVAPITLPVLIHGETGAGKELVARVIHRLSGRSGRLVVFNAATCTSELFEAELFGHRRGAFTGAHRDREGLIAQAHGGTLFLDEAAELGPVAQAILLRFLDCGEVRPVGADAPRTIRTRIVAATHRHLNELVACGRFRQDLYFRLAGTEIHIPPLRARREDVLALTRHFAHERGIPIAVLERFLAAGFGERLRRYPWPGNVRQLRHLMDHLAALLGAGAPEREIQRAVDRALSIAERASSSAPVRSAGGPEMREISRETLLELLKRHGGNISHIARELQTYRTHVYRLLRKRGIDLCRYRT